ncbi:OmpA family protein [Burkholderia ubonensis]|uniref:OmpA family protein n=1 Tax=Burkholderia ubonensis TaxID=101571 RepID=UPI000B508ED0|nr:OmpA family protein [Burkholderia ubonensis]
MMKRRYIFVILMCTLMLSGCGGMVPITDKNGAVVFPDRSTAWLKEGAFPNVENLRQVRPGLTKDQVYALIREPHFDEGLFGVHVWNYIFNINTPNDKGYATCQYQIQYDDEYRVKVTYWKEPACVKLLADYRGGESETAAPAPASSPVATAPAPVEHVNLAGDALFATGLATLTPTARATLDALLAQQGDTAFTRVSVTGYTDSVGSDASNLALSQHRAQAVAGYLKSHGRSARTADVTGRGRADPLASNATAEGRTSNRRVEISLER